MSPELPESLEVALRVIEVLEELGIRYHVGGSFASAVHGVPRQTQDIDLVVAIAPADAAALASALAGAFYVDEEEIRDAALRKGSCNLVHLVSAIKVDFFVRGDDPFDLEEFSRSRPEVVRGEPDRRIFVKTPEDTLLRKLHWYRLGGEASDRQWNDALGIARVQEGRLDRDYLSRWAQHLGVGDLLERCLSYRSV